MIAISPLWSLELVQIFCIETIADWNAARELKVLKLDVGETYLATKNHSKKLSHVHESGHFPIHNGISITL